MSNGPASIVISSDNSRKVVFPETGPESHIPKIPFIKTYQFRAVRFRFDQAPAVLALQ
jgi:hypothetical protein